MKKIFCFCLIFLHVAMLAFSGGRAERGEGTDGHNHGGHDHSEDRAEVDDNVRVLEDGFKEVSGNGFVLRWRIQDNNIEFTMEAPTLGWVAVGFKPSIMMKDADFSIAYVKDGMVFASDDFGVSPVGHQPDTSQGGTDDITILGGRELDGSTTIQLSRPLNSGDAYDQELVPGEDIKVIFAWGRNEADNFTTIHTRRGSLTLRL